MGSRSKVENFKSFYGCIAENLNILIYSIKYVCSEQQFNQIQYSYQFQASSQAFNQILRGSKLHIVYIANDLKSGMNQFHCCYIVLNIQNNLLHNF